MKSFLKQSTRSIIRNITFISEYIGWIGVKCFHTYKNVDWNFEVVRWESKNLEVVRWNSKNIILQRSWRASLCENFYVSSFTLLLPRLIISGGPHKRKKLLFESQCNEINLWHSGLLIYSWDLLKCDRDYEYFPRIFCAGFF